MGSFQSALVRAAVDCRIASRRLLSGRPRASRCREHSRPCTARCDSGYSDRDARDTGISRPVDREGALRPTSGRATRGAARRTSLGTKVLDNNRLKLTHGEGARTVRRRCSRRLDAPRAAWPDVRRAKKGDRLRNEPVVSVRTHRGFPSPDRSVEPVPRDLVRPRYRVASFEAARVAAALPLERQDWYLMGCADWPLSASGVAHEGSGRDCEERRSRRTSGWS
jgi:hypothetical protein